MHAKTFNYASLYLSSFALTMPFSENAISKHKRNVYFFVCSENKRLEYSIIKYSKIRINAFARKLEKLTS